MLVKLCKTAAKSDAQHDAASSVMNTPLPAGLFAPFDCSVHGLGL